jgi:hypothetical protein
MTYRGSVEIRVVRLKVLLSSLLPTPKEGNTVYNIYSLLFRFLGSQIFKLARRNQGLEIH